jgi:hypothetical protein
MIGDHYKDWMPKKYPDVFPIDTTDVPKSAFTWPVVNGISREEFDALKRDVEEMKALLKRAVKYDEDNNEPHCEIEEKMELLRKIAEAVGISLDDVIGKGSE